MITVGITTYNRLNYLKKTIDSLMQCRSRDLMNIRIYDDQSRDFGAKELGELIPSAKEIIVRKTNLGADENIRQMYENFLDTGDVIFFNGDADLLFHPGWVDFLVEFLPKTDGVLSLYNSNLHQGTENLTIDGQAFSICPHLGSAGTAFTRDVVIKIIREMKIDNSRCFDWKWSEYLINQGIRLISSQTSYIQHIGIQGQNANGLDLFNYGLNFMPGNEINTRYLIDFYEEALTGGLKNSLQAMESVKNTKDYRVGNLVLKMPRLVKRIIRKML
jgi:glycosyltransferase involved in cell wall biosynthesis